MFFKDFFDALGKVTDILNVGRLIFYPAAGFFVLYPTVMIFRLLTLPKTPIKTFFETLKDTAPTEVWLILGGSLVVGFLISAFGFATVIQPLSAQLKAEIDGLSLNKQSLPYQYPYLKKEDKGDYLPWLIAEFYRYVEIVIYIPLGMLLGLACLFVYTAVYLLCYAVAKPFQPSGEGYAFLLILAVILGISWFYIWEDFWKPRVIEPTLKTYMRAKKLLILGVENFQKENKPK